jgi:hypothetical protein
MLDWVHVTKVGSIFTFDFRHHNKKNVPALGAAHQTIYHIINNYPPPYTLYLSGGVDSQAMLYAWHTSGVEYQTYSAVYNFESNRYDLFALERFAKLHNIKINFQDFDLINFLETEHDAYANNYICGSPQITTFMKLSDLIPEGTAIFSGNFIHNGNVFLSSNNFGLYHYGKKSYKSIVPFFFMETMDLAYSFTNNDYTDTIKADYGRRVALYQSHGFPVLRQKEKQNGFEKIKEYYDENPPRQPSVQERMVRTDGQVSVRNFDLLYRNKYERKFSNYKYNILCSKN